MTGNNCADYPVAETKKMNNTTKKHKAGKKEKEGDDDEIAFLQGHPRHVPVLS